MKTGNSLFQILTITMTFAMSVQAQTFLTNGLVAYYPFNGNANDASGNGNNGTIQGATLTTNRFGMPNSAYAFDGVQSRIQIPETLFSATNPAVTISLWVTTDNGPYTGIPNILEKSGLNGAVAWQIYSNQFEFGAYLSTHTSYWASSPMISNSVTQLVGVYQQGQGVWLYTNGVLANSITGIPNLTLWVDTSGYQLVSAIGIYDWTPAPYNGFRGVIDDVRVYTRALSASEVQQLYQYESVPQTAPPVIASFAPTSGLVGTNVTITGLNFSPVTSNNIVFFGAVRATVTAASATNLTVTVPVGATYVPITETVNGLTAYSDQPFLPTFPGTGQINGSTLAARINLPTGSQPADVCIADLDGDGRPDLLVADSWSGEISIYQNISINGTLSFAPRLVLPMIPGPCCNPSRIVVADLDGDGRPDIIALNGASNLVSILRNISSPGILTTNSFASRIDIPTGNYPWGMAVQDLNGDGKSDIVVDNYNDNTISIFQDQSTIGNISFAPRVNYACGNGPNGLVIADLDGDGNPDIAVANSPDSTISIFRNLGEGGPITTNSFAQQVVLATPPHTSYVTIGDLDGDGKPDMIASCGVQVDTISVFRNITSGPGITTNSFAPHIDFPLPGWGFNTALGDLDGGGKVDLAAVGQLNDFLSLFHNASTPGSFTTSSLGTRVDFASGYNPHGIVIGDLNGDGKPDVVTVNQYDGNISIYLNKTPSPTVPTITSQPQDAYVDAYGSASFSVTATRASSYQWLFSGSNVLNATSSTLTFANVVQSELGPYSVVAANSYGAVTSSIANLYMYPAIVTPFTGLVTDWGQSSTLSVLAWGSGVLTFQWYDNGVAIPNATNSTLTFSAIQFTNAGSYSVVVSSSLGSVTNTAAQVVVNPAGVSLGLYPGITVTGAVGYTYDIQSNPDLTNPNGWTTEATLTLWQPVEFWVDVNHNAASPTNQHRFYRVLPGQ